jgi:adenosine deaminase
LNLASTSRLRELVQIGDDEDYTFENFLSKFETLRLFYRSPDIIERITEETIADAAADNVRYLELRFTPVALSRSEGFSLGEVMDWVIKGVKKAEKSYGLKTRLIASVNRHEGVDQAIEVAQLALDRRDQGIVGLDLAGNEASYSGDIFAGVFREAKEAGMYITIHAGEWGGPENVRQAIEDLSADRIGHGVRILEDPTIALMARDCQIPFEVCVTSNYQSGVVPALTVHPLPRMLSLGLNVTVNTDDPSISQIELGDEYRLVCEELGWNLNTLRECVIAAAEASFLPDEERQELVNSLAQEFQLEKEQ